MVHSAVKIVEVEGMRRLSWLRILAVLVLTSVAPVAIDDAAPAQATLDSLAHGEPEVGNSDLDDYVSAYGVSPDEARDQWTATDTAGELQVELVKTEADVFGGLWIEREPTFAIVVAVLPGGEKAVQERIDGLGLAAVARIQQVQRTLEQLRADQAAVSAVADGIGIDIAAGVDQSEGRVKVFVETSDDAGRLASVPLPESVVLVQRSLPTPAVEIYGGLSLSPCTSGFNVQQTNGSSEQGVTTAAHCDEPVSYNGTTLPLVDDLYQDSTDAQWHTTPGFTDPNKIRVTSSGTTRNVTSRKPLNQMVEGEAVCKYGKTTLFDCGDIEIVPFDPGDVCVPSSNNTFVYVVPNPNAGDMAESGDSGGPVFHDNPAKAYGTIACQSGDDMVFMPQNFLPNIGVEVDITTP